MPLVNPQQLASQIAAVQARWTPGTSWIDNLTDAQRATMVGVTVNQAEMRKIKLAAARAPARPIPALPPAVDWRTRDGRNRVSPVKNQGTCGACVSFSACALVEAMSAIERNRTFDDLSEAELFFCSAHGPNCSGWWPSDALETLKTSGAVSEALFPYVSAFNAGMPSCIAVPNRDALATRITSWSTLYTTWQRKQWLLYGGPLCSVFHLYFDFFNYRAGVYSHVAGAEAGYHCVEVVGYSDPDGCWICKNSWGDTWGENGYVRIAYGQCGIDDTSTDTDPIGNPLNFPAWVAQGVTGA
jgi:C1A family cysteine protease